MARARRHGPRVFLLHVLILVGAVLVTTAASSHPPYRRAEWPHWIDADGDCQNTRAEVLLRDAPAGTVTFRDERECTVEAGQGEEAVQRGHQSGAGRPQADASAYENGKLLRLPIIRSLKESGPRQGFFEREQFEAVKRHLRPDLQVAVEVAYVFGWRMQSEVLTLERRRHLDLEAGRLRLDPGTTKNDEGRLVYLPATLEIALREQAGRVHALERRSGQIIPWLFPYLKGHRQGQRIQDFRKAWATACKKAGLAVAVEENGKKVVRPLRIRHDFRRTAFRNMFNAGIPERVAMKVTGHRTRSVFDRYHIVSPGDLREVARKLTGTFSGTSGQVPVDRASANV